ncbi:hypothetical protein HY065_00485 [Candidatus Berkelbacteria bacterium]|nr:hypothetical protein [Candidatus Berkelbacteria bacterium]
MDHRYRQVGQSVTLYCFTPAVSLATFLIELLLTAYSWWKFRSTQFGKLITLFILILGLFQLAEFAVCKTGYPVAWARFGLAVIAFLPAMGLQAVAMVTKRNLWVPLSYLLATLFAAVILFAPHAVIVPHCLPNFIEFRIPLLLSFIYAVFYWGYVVFAMLVLLHAMRRAKQPNPVIKWLLVAYAVSTVPTLLLHLVLPYTIAGHASVFCGFAILMAVVLVTKVLPSYATF